MRGNIGNILKQAQAVQENIQKAQEQVTQLTATGAGFALWSSHPHGKPGRAGVEIDRRCSAKTRRSRGSHRAAINDEKNKVAWGAREMAGARPPVLPPG